VCVCIVYMCVGLCVRVYSIYVCRALRACVLEYRYQGRPLSWSAVRGLLIQCRHDLACMLPNIYIYIYIYIYMYVCMYVYIV
jgi:hypothetical protein